METIIQTVDLTFRYRDTAQGEAGQQTDKPLVLNQINLQVEKGSFVAILGHNGSGKSTLAKQFNAILLPESGFVYVSGMDTKDDDRLFDIRQSAGMVFQNPDNQIVSTIVEDDVAFAPENLGVDPKEIRQRVDQALKDVDMTDFKDRSPAQLSGGQKQRVAIAGIIAMRPKCIILDEPTAMLDPKGRKEVMATVEQLNREYGITIILITHFMSEAARAQRIVVMDEGKIILDGTPRTVFHQVELLHQVGLDVPDATELAYELSTRGIAMQTDVLTVDECVEAVLDYQKKAGEPSVNLRNKRP